MPRLVACLLMVSGCVANDGLAFVTVGDLSPPDLAPPPIAFSTRSMEATGAGVIYIGDKPELCADLSLTPPGEPRNLTAIQIIVAERTPDGSLHSPQAPGAFLVGAASGKSASAESFKTDSACVSKPGERAVSGAVTLTSIAADAYVGSYDLMMADYTTNAKHHVEGSFEAPDCPAVIRLVSSGTPNGPLCM